MLKPDEARSKLETGRMHAAEAIHDVSEAATDAAKEFKRSLGERGSRCCDDVADYITKNPLQALGMAGLVGALLGLLTRRRRFAPQFRCAESDRLE